MARVIQAPQETPNVAVPDDFLHQLQSLSWVDHTALGVLLVFFVIGLFKGLIWQVSRIAILVVAYVVSGRYGNTVAEMLAGQTAAPATPGGTTGAGETTIYLAYVLLFLAVLIVLSLLAMLVQKLAAKAGLSFFDRLGGGVLGVATGACVVLFGLFVVNMFFRGSQLALAAESSHSLRLGKRAIDWLGDKVPDDLRQVFQLTALQPFGRDGQGGAIAPLPGNPVDATAPSAGDPAAVPAVTPPGSGKPKK